MHIPTRREAVGAFLNTFAKEHLAKLYSPEMEIQVNVAQGNGERIGGEYRGKRWVGYTDGVEKWKSFRIPWNAKQDPHYEDSEMNFNLAAHVESIGMTGWNWEQKKSCWFGYDIDSITNHKEGLSDEELEEITQKLYELDYCTLLKSTSGRGLHLYIHLDEPFATETHTDHAACARALLSVLSFDVGFNFNNAVDCCGMVLWCYHVKSRGTPGLTLLREGKRFPVERIPDNWRSHVQVTSGNRRRIAIGNNEIEKQFNFIANATRRNPLDDKHKVFLKWMQKNAERDNWWDNDYNMLVCHTLDLQTAHRQLGLKGIFHTSTSGSSSQNCFAFPAEDGSWIVRRHSLHVKEHPSWYTDMSGWTRCVYNAASDLLTCVRSNGGIENGNGDFHFDTVEQGLQALEDLGLTIISESLKSHTFYEKNFKQRSMKFKRKSEDRLVVVMEGMKDFDTEVHKSEPIQGFVSSPRGDRWERVIRIPIRKRNFSAPDYLVRHVVSNQEEAGWFINTKKSWVMQNRNNVETVLQSQQDQHGGSDIKNILSKAILDPWELVNIPFAEEYPGNRQWNKDASKFTCRPEEGPCDTWMQVIAHVGKNLDSAVVSDPWCYENGVTTGKDYILLWVANMLQKPTEPLPYLFMVGPQNCGKSTLHEALSLLMERGYARADNALTSQSGFNYELANTVLCVVEEINVAQNREAQNRIKDWVTGKTICIRRLYSNAYDIVNTTHWIQCANDVHYCPVFPGDTRIVVIGVDQPEKEIPKHVLFAELDKEKKAFLHLCLNLEIPQTYGRLGLPCIKTAMKSELMEETKPPIERFIDEEMTYCPGALTQFNEFYTRFNAWLDVSQRLEWTSHKVARQFPKGKKYCKGKSTSNNQTLIGNLTFNEGDKPSEYGAWYADIDGKLRTTVEVLDD